MREDCGALAAANPRDYFPIPMNGWPAAVLFDFDGVLVNSEPLHFRAMREALRDEKIELSEDKYYRELVGFADREAFIHVLQKLGRGSDTGVLGRLMRRKAERMMRLIHGREYDALPGVRDFVNALARHYPLAVCSGALRAEVEAMLEGVGLRECFAIVVAAEDVSKGKPDPEGYLLTARRVGEKLGREIEPADCLVVEDAPPVISATRAAGFPVLAVASTYPAEMLVEANWIVRALVPEEVGKKIPGLRM